jgi:hypothetical protein
MISACGGLRYSQVDPEAGNFHPRRLGVLPVDVGTYEEARGTVDQMIAGVLTEKKWFNDVVAGDDINRQFHANEEFRAIMTDYMAKLKTVNFSDPQLSARIGELCQVDSFLVVSVDYWNYTAETETKWERSVWASNDSSGNGKSPLEGGPFPDGKIPVHQT